VADGTFRTSGFRPQPVDDQHLPYGSPATLPDSEPHDATGVRLYLSGGRKYDHPVAQAQFGLQLLATYRHDRDRAVLDLALKQARRIVAHRKVVGDAWFYPYPFDFALHNDPRKVQRAPWYSGMAQGLALSLFARLSATTGDRHWRQAADATFDSLLLPPSDTAPWVTHVDEGGYAWIDEYPERPAPRSDLTFNGHQFGVAGLFDYQRILPATEARRSAALALLDGAETTSRHYLPAIRNAGWVSKYCLQDGVLNATYHAIHIVQLAQLYTFTHVPAFAEYADDLRRDYPAPAVAGTIHFRPGHYELARFEWATGRRINSQTVDLYHSDAVHTRTRQRIIGQGIWLLIDTGPYQGWYVREVPRQVWLGGVSARLSYYPARPISVDGDVTGYRPDRRGGLAGLAGIRIVTFSHSTLLVDQTADVDGRESWRVTAGPLAGYWLPATGH
jgi:hypothetical protein